MVQSADNDIPHTFLQVYKADYKTIYFDASSSILLNIWNTESEKLTTDGYKEDAFHLVKIMEQHKAKALVSDIRESQFFITPELQLWYAETIVPKLVKAGLQRTAVVLNENLNVLNSLEEIVANYARMIKKEPMPHRFFQDLGSALHWLKR